MGDAAIQHRQTFSAPSSFGFDDAGERVPVVGPKYPDDESERGSGESDASRIRQETIVRVLSWLAENGTAEFVGRKVLVVSYLLKLPTAPRTLEELGARMGVGKARASQIVSELNSEFGAFTRVLQ